MVVDTKLPSRIVIQRGYSHRSLESDEGSTIPTTSRKRQASLRRVRFSSSPTVKENVKVAFIPSKEEVNASQVYYSRQEIRKMWTRAKKNAEYVSTSQMTVAQSIDQLFEAAMPDESSSGTYEELSGLYESSARGLERLISDHMTEQRKAAVKSILEVQASTKSLKRRSDLLRMRSLLESRKARNFAERLAAADAVSAQL